MRSINLFVKFSNDTMELCDSLFVPHCLLVQSVLCLTYLFCFLSLQNIITKVTSYSKVLMVTYLLLGNWQKEKASVGLNIKQQIGANNTQI